MAKEFAIAPCAYCEQGLISIAKCRNCEEPCAVCDECEAIWSDPRHVVADDMPADGQHPQCPHCFELTEWDYPGERTLNELGFGDLFGE